MNVKCVIADLDDTLVNTTKAIQMAQSEVLQKLADNHRISLKRIIAINNQVIGDIIANKSIKAHEVGTLIWKKMFESLNIPHDENIINLHYKNFHNELCKNLHLNDFVEEFCEYLRMHNTRLIVLSNGLHEERLERIKKVKLDKYISKVYSSESIGFDKHDINAINHIFKENNLNSEETIIIGDSYTHDIEPIINTNIIAIHYKKGPSVSKNYYQFGSFIEIKEFLEGLSNAEK